MIALAILFGFTILMNGGTFAAIHGRFAQQLDIPGSSVIPFIPWVALLGFIAAVILIKRMKTTWKRWVSFIAAYFMASLLTAYPVELLERGSKRIPIADFLNSGSKDLFEESYSIKWVSYNSGEGTCIRIRRADYSDSLAEFLNNLVKQQAEQ